MEKNACQDHGGLTAHIAGQGANDIPVPDRFSGRYWNRDSSAGPHPCHHSLAQQDDETEAAAGGLTEHFLSQLFVTSFPVFSGQGLGERFVYCGFF